MTDLSQRVCVHELAARRYCELLGLDPDDLVPDPDNNSMAYVTCPRWQAERQFLLRFAAALAALGRTLPQELQP